jgi:hypothetical protein
VNSHGKVFYYHSWRGLRSIRTAKSSTTIASDESGQFARQSLLLPFRARTEVNSHGKVFYYYSWRGLRSIRTAQSSSYYHFLRHNAPAVFFEPKCGQFAPHKPASTFSGPPAVNYYLTMRPSLFSGRIKRHLYGDHLS